MAEVPAAYDIAANPSDLINAPEQLRQQTLQSQGTMIAPAPLEMTPEEKVLSMEKQMGNYNPGGDVEMASNFAEANLAQQAFPQQMTEDQSAAQQLDPNSDFIENDIAAQKQINEQKKIDMFGPLYEKMKANDDLANASKVLEGSRQSTLDEKAGLQAEQVKEYQNFKQKYDNAVNTRLVELDGQLKQVEEDAKLSRQSTGDLFSQKSSGQKMAAGIAMILGAAGGVMTGTGRNLGLETVMNTLESERKHLLSNFANSKEMLDLKRKNMDDYNEAMMRQMQVADRQKMLQMQVLSTKLDMAESKYRGTAAGLAAKNTNADIKMQINSMKMQQSQADAINNIMKNGQSVDDLPLQAAAAILGQKPGEILKDRRERTVPLPGNKTAYAIDVTSADKARPIVAASETIQQNLKKIQDIVKKSPIAVKGGSLTAAGQEAQTALGEITAAMKGLETLGALDNGVIKLVDGIVKNPASIINQADYEKIAQSLKQGANNKLESFGVKGYTQAAPNYEFQQAGKGTLESKFGKYLKQK